MLKLAAQSDEMTFPGLHDTGQTRSIAGPLPGFYTSHLLQLVVIVAHVATLWASKDS